MNDQPDNGSTPEVDLSNVTRENLLDKFGGFEDLMLESIGIFLEDAPLRIKNIQEAINKGSAEDLTVSAHTLKGSLGYFDEGGVYQAALSLEMAGRKGDMEGVERFFDDLMTGLDALMVRLKQISAA